MMASWGRTRPLQGKKQLLQCYLLGHGLQPGQPVLRLLQGHRQARVLVLQLQGCLHDLLHVGAAKAVHALVQVGARRFRQDVGQSQAAGTGRESALAAHSPSRGVLLSLLILLPLVFSKFFPKN